MFDTIPILHAFDVRLVGEDEAGREITAGCVLPGFTAYPQPEDVRYYNAFYRLLLADEMVAYRDAYLRKVAGLLPAHFADEPDRHWSVVVDQEYTRNLFHSRRDGQVSMLVRKTFDLTAPRENP